MVPGPAATSLAFLWWFFGGGSAEPLRTFCKPAAPDWPPDDPGAGRIFGGFFGTVSRNCPVLQGVASEAVKTAKCCKPLQIKARNECSGRKVGSGAWI